MCEIYLCVDRFGLGWAHDAICFACHMFMYFPCICTLFSIYLLYFNFLGLFWLSFFLSLSFCLRWSCLWHLSINPLRPGTLFIPVPLRLLILALSIFGSMMMMPTRHSRRTFLDKVFIRNTKSYWQTSPTLTFPLSFTIRNGSHCVTFRLPVLLCLSRSFTPTCTRLIVQYLFSSLAFEVRAFLSHHNLLRMCFGSLE